MAFDNLAVRIGAQTADVTSGISSVKRAFGSLSREAVQTDAALDAAGDGMDDARDDAVGLSAGLIGAQTAADQASDEFGEIARNAGLAAAGMSTAGAVAGGSTSAFTSLAVSTEGLSLSFGSLTTSVAGTVAILGVLGTVVTGLATTLVPLAATLGALTAGAGALAGSFGAIIGTGILAFGEQRGEQNEERLRQVRRQIDRLEELRSTEEGLTDSQAERLSTLEEQADSLEEQTGVMGGLQSAFADLRTEVQPLVTEFGAQFVPLISDALDALPSLVRNVLDAAGGVDTFVQVLRRLGGGAADALPGIVSGMVDLSRQALPPFMDFVSFLSGQGSSAISGMVRTAKELAPELLGVADALIDILPSVNKVGTGILSGLLPALEEGIRGFGDLLDNIIAFANSESGQETIAALQSAMQELGPEVNTLIDLVTKLVGKWADELPSFIRGATAFADSLLDIANFALKTFMPILDLIIDGVARLSDAFADFTGRSERGEQNLLSGEGPAFTRPGDVAAPTPSDLTASRFRGGGGGPSTLELDVQGDGVLSRLIEEQTEARLRDFEQNRSRERDRLRGRGA